MANLNEKIIVKQQIEDLLATLDRKDAFEILDSILTNYPMEILDSLIKDMKL